MGMVLAIIINILAILLVLVVGYAAIDAEERVSELEDKVDELDSVLTKHMVESIRQEDGYEL